MRLLDLVRVADVGGAPDPLIDLAAAKRQLGIEHDDHNALIAEQRDAVLDHLEGYSGILGRVTVRQTWRLCQERFPAGRVLQLPLPPLMSVSSVAYRDANGADQALVEDTDFHVLDGPRAQIVLASGASWPATECHPRAVTVTFVCGYGEAADVPNSIRSAALLMIQHLYEGGAVDDDLPAVTRLLRPFAVPRV